MSCCDKELSPTQPVQLVDDLTYCSMTVLYYVNFTTPLFFWRNRCNKT
jgi:hypothetical protein